MQYQRADAMTLRSDEKYDEMSMKILYYNSASATAFISPITAISINQQMNIIQHPFWGKIFLFQDDYVCI